MKAASFSVQASAILLEARNDYAARPDPVVGMVMGLDMIRVGLGRIAARAIELGDPELLRTLNMLCCVKPAAASSSLLEGR